MKQLLVVLLMGLSIVGCQKKPDPPAPAAAPVDGTTPPPATNPPPPVSSCQGATVMYSLPGGELINDNSQRDFVIPNFELSCGDTVTVFIRNPLAGPGQGWTQLHDIPNGASYYSVLNQTITVRNSTGIVVECAIEAVLK